MVAVVPEVSNSGLMIRYVSFWICEDCPWYDVKGYGDWVLKPEDWKDD